ncbi:MAG: haloacid dehalogenase type II [Pseudomonadota bacterium]
MTKSLTDYKALTFDCYGTLIDWEGGIWDALQPLLLANGRADIDRNTALLAFAEAESAQEAATPDMIYPQILENVHRALAKRFDLATSIDMDRVFGTSVPHWPAFADTADALRRLKRHYKLVILSNVNRDGFAASSRKLGVEFDAVYTAQDVGSYKPNDDNFAFMLERMQADHGLGQFDILHTAQSLFHDHVPATRAGLDKAWIDRQRLAEGGSWGATAEVPDQPDVDFRFITMMEMAEAADAAFAD